MSSSGSESDLSADNGKILIAKIFTLHNFSTDSNLSMSAQGTPRHSEKKKKKKKNPSRRNLLRNRYPMPHFGYHKDDEEEYSMHDELLAWIANLEATDDVHELSCKSSI